MKHNTFDAQAALGFVISQTSHIEQQVNEVRYPDIQYPFLIPVDTSAHPFAKTVTYFSADRIGQAKWINGNADDMPKATTERTKHETSVFMAGIGYGYGFEEINQAQMLGINLTADDAMAARRAYEEFVDTIALEGDAAKGFEGLFNTSAITPAAATTGDWSNVSTTGDQILADVNNALSNMHVNTKTVELADTLLLPWSCQNLIASKRLGDTNMTVLEFLRRNNVYTATTGQQITIRGSRRLDTAGVSGVRRMVAYRRDPRVLKLHIPMPHRFLPVYQAGPLRFEVPGVFRLGGLDIRYPGAVTYIDGI